MAFVHRTTRETCRIDGFVPETNVTQEIGPGHYDVEAGDAMLRQRCKANSRAPFLSTSLRDGARSRAVAPGPGEYYNPEKRPETLGVACQGAFKSQTKRFQDVNKDLAAMPAPGQYDVVKSPPARMRQAHQHGDKLRAESLATAFDLGATAPSIPAGDLQHGYVVDDEGRIRPRRRATSARARAPGPGSYEHTSPQWTRARGAVAFDKQAPRQVGQRPSAVPGPGHYHEGQKSSEASSRVGALLNPTLADFIKPSLHAAFASTSQRTSGAPKNAAEMPGPGQYAVHELSSKQWVKGSANVNAKGFGTTSARFGATTRDQDDLQGPDYIAPKSTFVDTWRRDTGVHRPGVGFCSSSARLPEKSRQAEGPGIGQYRIPGMVDEMLLNLATAPKRKTAPFGTSSCRFRRAPAQTQRNEKDHDARLRAIERRKRAHAARARSSPTSSSKAYASVFASKTRRWSGAQTQTGPDPGAYEIDRVTSLAADLARKGATQKGVMDSAENRFQSARPGVAQAPGPGQYYKDTSFVPSVSKRQRGRSSSRQHRDPAATHSRAATRHEDSTPGPGQYHSSDATSSLLKPTYNLSIAIEEEQALRRLGVLP